MSGPVDEGSGSKKESESRLSRGLSRNEHSPVRPPELMSATRSESAPTNDADALICKIGALLTFADMMCDVTGS
jgi:hypothetical protein